ncbi:MAG: hypothetical protein GY716_06105 [bacterium]|nr:hypothetical protein [bacterium]
MYEKSNGARTRRLIWVALCGAMLLGLAAGTPGYAGGRDCISAEVEYAIRFPDGELLPPGRLRLCGEVLSPIANLHRMYVDGRPVGMLISRRSVNEADPGSSPAVFFSRGDDGQLELVGYVQPGRGRNVSFRFGSERTTPSSARRGGAWRREGGLLVLAAAQD